MIGDMLQEEARGVYIHLSHSTCWISLGRELDSTK